MLVSCISLVVVLAAGAELTLLLRSPDTAFAHTPTKPERSAITDTEGLTDARNHHVEFVRLLFRPNIQRKNSSDRRRTPQDRSNTAIPTLVGIIVEDDRRVAIFHFGNAIHSLHENMAIGKWSIVRIERRSAALQSGFDTRVLTLDPPQSR